MFYHSADIHCQRLLKMLKILGKNLKSKENITNKFARICGIQIKLALLRALLRLLLVCIYKLHNDFIYEDQLFHLN